MNFSPKNIGMGAAAIVVLLGLGWYFFGGSSSTDSPLTASGAVPNPVETQFLTLTSELTPISFDPQVFSDPKFAALVDLTTPVSPESAGREDPFAPIAGGSASSGK